MQKSGITEKSKSANIWNPQKWLRTKDEGEFDNLILSLFVFGKWKILDFSCISKEKTERETSRFAAMHVKIRNENQY